MPNEVEREWLSVKELGVLTGLGRTKLYEVVASGELEAIKVVRVGRSAGGQVRPFPRTIRGLV